MKVEVGTPSDVEQFVERDVMDFLPAPPDVLLLSWTIVRDSVVPGGLEWQFASLEAAIAKGAARVVKRTAGSDNLSSAVWCTGDRRHPNRSFRSEKLAVDQFPLASTERPTKF